MGLVADRVLETSATAGTGTVTLAGAVVGHRSFAAAFVNGNVVSYCIEDGVNWEVGEGTYNAGTLARTTVQKSSNGNLHVDFPTGTKRVFNTYTAENLAPGVSLPVGGSTGQALVKLSGADGDAGWGTVTGGGGGGGGSITPHAFSAYAGAATALTNAAYTKVGLNTKAFDTDGVFDATTNSRFQPTLPGYYQINGSIHITSGTGSSISGAAAAIYKNGAKYKVSSYLAGLGTDGYYGVADCIYLNGSTDYVELWCYVSCSSSTTAFAAQAETYLSGFMAGGTSPSGPSTVIPDATAARTLSATDIDAYVRMTDASAKAYTFPLDSTYAAPTNSEGTIRCVGAGTLTLTAASGVTLNLPSGGSTGMTAGMTIGWKKVGANEFDIFGQTV